MDERARSMRVTVCKDGPYRVSGGAPLLRAEIVVNDAGESVGWDEAALPDVPACYTLCRCGESGAKPYCDGTHVRTGFDGTETASHDSFLEQSVCITGPGMHLRDVRILCAEARFCDREGGLWNLVEHCDDSEALKAAEEQAGLCPAGRYVACDPESDEPHEPALDASIALVEDPQMGASGPVWVRGGIPIVGSDGLPYEVRNRVTLCRCGKSSNKPFCDGAHLAADFKTQE